MDLFDSTTRTSDESGGGSRACPEDFLLRYQEILARQRLSWREEHHLVRLLGFGGQGVVYLSEGRGTDGFMLPVALKIFAPERYSSQHAYDKAMSRVARVSSRVAHIQHDNLVHVHHWVDRGSIRVMEMEWIDGFDLRKLLTRTMLDRARDRMNPRRWAEFNDVVVTDGPVQPRLKPGIAVAVVRGCLGALDALHRAGIIHADVKPSNIMLKRTGTAKLIDIGAAFHTGEPPLTKTCTPMYAAPEVLDGSDPTQQSDLASLGYLLVEALSGRPPFTDTTFGAMVRAKQRFSQDLPDLLPEEVRRDELLVHFCRRLVAADPAGRFPTAEDADLDHTGAAGFHRHLVKHDLSSEYSNDIRRWLMDMGEL